MKEEEKNQVEKCSKCVAAINKIVGECLKIRGQFSFGTIDLHVHLHIV